MDRLPAPLPIRRDKSYRKPAPLYTPSPPPSPAAPSMSALPWSSVLIHSPGRESVPPLPSDWKEILQRAADEDLTSTVESGVLDERAKDTREDVYVERNDTQTSTEVERVPQSPPRSPRRGLPQTFRPPTPPLPAHNRKRKSRDEQALVRAASTPTIEVPVPRRRHAPSSSLQTLGGYPSRLEPLRYTPAVERPRPARPPLTAQASFRTEGSVVSSVTLVSPPSTGCGTVRSTHHDDATSDQWHDVPVLPMHIVKLPRGKPETNDHAKAPLETGPTDCLGSLFTNTFSAFKDVFKHALGGCFGARLLMDRESANTRHPQSKHEIYDKTLSGAIDPPRIPKLRSDDNRAPQLPLPRSLVEFREEEGREIRKRRLRALWSHICEHGYLTDAHPRTLRDADLEKAETLRAEYEHELLGRCAVASGSTPTGKMATHTPIEWKEFKEYAEAKEVELWGIFHDELDLDGNGRLDAQELDMALRKSGEAPSDSVVSLSQATLSEFMTFLTSSPHSRPITFAEFRDFLLLLPRKISPAEIYRYYQLTKFLGDDGRGAARVTMEGDVSLSAEDKPPPPLITTARALTNDPSGTTRATSTQDESHSKAEDEEGDDDVHSFLDHHTALKFLLAGGIAGAVEGKAAMGGVKAIGSAVARIYAEGGVMAFWVGNGLSVAKIFPESAIKFFSYESSKRAFAKYWDGVDDPRNISGVSRFISGGIGGISSQLSIYPIETLKTQMMSSTGQRRTLLDAARHLWGLGGLRAYYRGLAIGLLGVFPYSAIDMSTFEALKLGYLRSTGKDEPGVLALLAFGSLSGSVGATSVYPMNLVRTRMQASGSSGHPQIYTGPWDVAVKTFEKEGWRGFYRGLVPTLAKVVPSVSISYVVYEHSKRRLGVAS
ncbi:hypothetical protein V5O48_005060 [Marasmius crinis-equi]|uniref:EF-hand domain-containing protein n=1 Tax=Marasmius crinis-equi TaxID=585013 RepID=A0ABR3FNR5_9AGAR